MKQLLLSVMLLSAAMLSAEPIVNITVDGTTNTTIDCSFEKNSDCSAYYIVASRPEDIEPWVGTPFGGATLEETVEQFGIEYTTDSSYKWTEMVPNTMYVIYVTAKDAAGTRVLYTDTAYTCRGGGPGESIITLKVEDINDYGATLTATPNEETMLFKDMVMETSYIDAIFDYYYALDTATAVTNTGDSIFRMLLLYGTEFYEEDSYPWATLDPGTQYTFIARGMNADSIWGTFAMAEFTTTGTPSAVEDVEVSSISVYPNPATDWVMVNGVEPGEAIEVIDLRGVVVMETHEPQITVSGLQSGVYFIRCGNTLSKFIKR